MKDSINKITKDVVLNYLTRQNKDVLRELSEAIDELLKERAKPVLFRSMDEYQTARVENADEELPFLSEPLIAPGRQFCLTKAQKIVAEGMVGKLAHKEVTVYNVSTDALEERVLSFSVQCNIPATYRRQGGMVSAFHISDAKEFFHKSHMLQEELDAGVEKKETKKKKSSSKREQSLDEIVNMLLS
jgi:hypothetical protein